MPTPAGNERNKAAMMKVLEAALTNYLLLTNYRQDSFQIEILDGNVVAEVNGIIFDITVEVRE